MQFIKLRSFLTIALFLAAAAALSARAQPLEPGTKLPAGCEALEIPASSILVFHTYAIGVQIYSWTGSNWAFVAPSANLYASPRFRGLVGTHYAGPTWESNSGSFVVGARVAGCSPDPTAIPWLLLEATSSGGPGVLAKVGYIQRVNTFGGLAPSAPGSAVGELSEVPYTAEYYFYKSGNR